MPNRFGVIYNGVINGLNVNIRYATQADYDDVIRIDDDVYDGADYLPTKYMETLNDPASHAFLGEVKGTVVTFACYVLSGADNTMTVGTAGRMAPKYRNRNVFVTFSKIVRAEMKRLFPVLKYNWGVARYCEQMVRNTTNNNGRVLNNWIQVIHKVPLRDIREMALGTHNGGVEVATVSGVMAVLSDQCLLDVLYPHGNMLTATKFQPVPARPQDIRKAIRMNHVHMSGAGETLGLSTVHMYTCTFGVVLIICYSGHEAGINDHVVQALRHCAAVYGLSAARPSGYLPSTSQILVVVDFPLSITGEHVASFLRTTLPGEIPVELFEAGLFETPY